MKHLLRARFAWPVLAVAVIALALPALAGTRSLDLREVPSLRVTQAGVVQAGGDVNGDGKRDVILGNLSASPQGRNNAGSVYVVFGPLEEGTRTTDELVAQAGFRIHGAFEEDSAGQAVAGGFDANGDGLDDILIGAPMAYNSRRQVSGVAYVVFGKKSTSTVDLRDFHTTTPTANGFRMDGVGFASGVGAHVDGLGDVNSDGLDDFLVGTDFSTSVYVVFGKKDPMPIDLLTFHLGTQGDAGYRIRHPEPATSSLIWSSSAGDANGDGRPDVYVEVTPPRGSGLRDTTAWVVFGKGDNNTVNVLSLGRGGYELGGLDPGGGSIADFPGRSDDINGDGLGDLVVIGGLRKRANAYVIFGKKGTKPIDPRDLGRHGYRIRGFLSYSPKGYIADATGIGDINRDGRPDIVLGASLANFNKRPYSGSVFVVYGKKSTKTLRLSDLGHHGYRIDGARRGDNLGEQVAGPGNVGGNRRPDIIADVRNGRSEIVFRRR